MSISGKQYSDKEKAAEEIMNAVAKALVGNVSKSVCIGEYKGFKLEVFFDALDHDTKMDICGNEKY